MTQTIACTQGDATNCHSFQLADGYNGRHPHENYTTFTKSLNIEASEDEISNGTQKQSLDFFLPAVYSEDDNVSFVIQFKTVMSNPESSVEFQAVIVGETLSNTWQVCKI